MLATVGAGKGSNPGQLAHPYDVASDAAGRLFVADDLNHRVVRFSAPPRYPYKGRWGAYGTTPGRLAYPRGLAVGPQGQIYVANTGNDRIDVFDRGGALQALLRGLGPRGRRVRRADGRRDGRERHPRGHRLGQRPHPAARPGRRGPGPVGRPGARADAAARPRRGRLRRRRQRLRPRPAPRADPRVQPHHRHARCARSARRAADRASCSPRRRSPSTRPARSPSPTRGNRRLARFTLAGAPLAPITSTGAVRGVAVTPDGARIYTTNTEAKIQVYSPAGELLDDFGGKGRTLGKLDAPAQIALDAGGNLWVADRGNNRVQEFGPNGERLLTMGERGIGAGQFVHPTGVSVDCHGTLTVTDTDNNRVQQFTLAAPAVAPCGVLPALGNPPPPKLPTLPAAGRPAADGPPAALERRRDRPQPPGPRRMRHELHAHGVGDAHAALAAAEGPPKRDSEARHGEADDPGGRVGHRAARALERRRPPAAAGAARAPGTARAGAADGDRGRGAADGDRSAADGHAVTVSA